MKVVICLASVLVLGGCSCMVDSSQTKSAEPHARMEQPRELGSLHFPFDSAELTQNAKAELSQNADKLESASRLVVSGYADERGSDEYNSSLGLKRAESVKEYLATLGVDENKVVTQTFGEEQPARSDSTPEAWAQNRRVVIKGQS